MSTDLVALAVLMFAVTYPSRALGLVTPVLDKLPRITLDYLQLVGPAILAAIAAVSVMTLVDGDGDTVFHVGIEWVGVLACLLITARTRNLLLGLVVGVAIVAIARALGLAAIPGT
jgi:branched-subunit amino acid transport protein